MRKYILKFRSKKNIFIKNILPKHVYRSRMLSFIYYCLFDRSFDREIRAVLTGKVKHILETEKTTSNYFLLVRNIHRIEKGLLMKPKRDVFAKEYIGETITSFERIWSYSEMGDNLQMKWFYDVLNEYFLTSAIDPLIMGYKKRFDKKVEIELKSKLDNCTTKSIPYFRAVSNNSTITFEDFFKLTKQRRSVRWYLNKEVPRELIDRAIMAANMAPSACNRQPFEFRVFDSPDLVRQVVEIPMGTRGYGHSIPLMIVIVGNLDAYFDERDRHVIYIDGSLAAMSLMLALETMGLSSCSINWPDIENREMKMENFLGLEKFQRPLMCLSVGYPDPEGLVAFSEKRPLKQIRRYNNE